ncbi:MAG: DUF475 domain-containing protein [Spirulina sp. SIO3F2]|nr:DUF475 domain-containing protein [Spirulina sp. SIO3F2]
MLEQWLTGPIASYLHIPFLLVILVALEAILSADNAVALASIAQGLSTPQQQRRALNIGLVAAYGLRVALIFTATWVEQFWQVELLGAGYLLWLVWCYYQSPEDENHHHQTFKFDSLWQAIPILAFTDLAFSLDSVTTAIAVADQTWLIVVGGTIGVVALRFLAGVFLGWLQEYPRLEEAGYLAVALVGIRLLIHAVLPQMVPPEWLMVSLIVLVFAWGFSERVD